MPHFKAFGIMNLQYEIRIFQKIMIKTQGHKLVTTHLGESDFTSIFIWLKE